MRGGRANRIHIPSRCTARMAAIGILLASFAVAPHDHKQAKDHRLARLEILNRAGPDTYQLYAGPRYDFMC